MKITITKDSTGFMAAADCKPELYGLGVDRIAAVADLVDRWAHEIGIEIDDQSEDDADVLAAKIVDKCVAYDASEIAEVIRNHEPST